MTKLSLCGLLLLLIGCKPASDSTQPSRKVTREVPLQVMQRVPARLKLLKLGMTQQEALEILDLAPYNPRGFGNGPQNSWTVSYVLRTNCILTMGLDRTTVPTRLTAVRGAVAAVPAVLEGDGWKSMELP
jgi:hypothetical protein